MWRSAQCRVVAVFCGGIAVLAAYQEPVGSPSAQRFATSTNAVVIDVVVHDGNGRPVAGLRKEDFQLFEDGVQQDIGDATASGMAPLDVEGRGRASSSVNTASGPPAAVV